LKHVVIKIYSIDKYLAIAPLLFINHPNVEKVIATYSLDTMVVTVTEKITPLLNCYGEKNTNIEWASISREDMREQITKALTVIHNLKYLHNDVSFDNMGLKKMEIIILLFCMILVDLLIIRMHLLNLK